MGITDKVSQMVTSIHTGAKNASQSLFTLLLKLVSVFMVGLTMAMIGQELMHYGMVAFIFVLLMTGTALLRIIMNWTLGPTLVFDLICVLVALLLRMYIFIAP